MREFSSESTVHRAPLERKKILRDSSKSCSGTNPQQKRNTRAAITSAPRLGCEKPLPGDHACVHSLARTEFTARDQNKGSALRSSQMRTAASCLKACGGSVSMSMRSTTETAAANSGEKLAGSRLIGDATGKRAKARQRLRGGPMMTKAWRRSVIERTTERASEYRYSSHHFSRSVPMCALDLRAAESPPTG